MKLHAFEDVARTITEEAVLVAARRFRFQHERIGPRGIAQLVVTARIGCHVDQRLERVVPVTAQPVQLPRVEEDDVVTESLLPVTGGDGRKLTFRIGDKNRAGIVQQVRDDDARAFSLTGGRDCQQVRLAVEEQRYAVFRSEEQAFGAGEAEIGAITKISKGSVAEDTGRGLRSTAGDPK